MKLLNIVFEIVFVEEEGRSEALARQHCVNQIEISFTFWRPNFNSKSGDMRENARLIHQAWAQVHGLPTLLWTLLILTEIVN